MKDISCCTVANLDDFYQTFTEIRTSSSTCKISCSQDPHSLSQESIRSHFEVELILSGDTPVFHARRTTYWSNSTLSLFWNIWNNPQTKVYKVVKYLASSNSLPDPLMLLDTLQWSKFMRKNPVQALLNSHHERLLPTERQQTLSSPSLMFKQLVCQADSILL